PLVAVGGDDAFRLDGHLLFEALRANPTNPAVVFDDRRRGRLQPDVGARLCRFLRHCLVEGVPLEDDSHLVAGVSLLDREFRAVRGEYLRPLDLASDPFAVERQFRIFHKVPRETLATTHWRADFLSFLNEEGAAATHRGVARGHRAGWTCADYHDVVLVRGHLLADLPSSCAISDLTLEGRVRSPRSHSIVC